MSNFEDDPPDAATASLLLVDDHPANLLALEAILTPLGHRLVRASSGREALLHESQEDFAVIFLDVHMPGMDGFETAALIKNQGRNKNTPIVFLTAVYGDEAHAFTAYEHGAVDYLTKPFHPNALRAKAAVFVDLHVRRDSIKRQAEKLLARERFIGMLGHDLRAPLASILVGASILTHHADLSGAPQKTAAGIARSAQRMSRMVHDLLDFTQSRAGGGIPTSPRPVDLAAVCTRVVTEELGVTYPHRTVLLSVEGDSRGTWDPDRVEQVVTNLVINALEHGPDDAPVRVFVHDDGPSVALEVHNEGRAIAADLLPVLFDPFRRAVRPEGEKRPKGLGLGLYIVDQIARAHGGRVGVSSTDEGGTRFIVHWPRDPRAP